MEIQRAFGPLDEATSKEIDAMFEYTPWDSEQVEAGKKVRTALAAAFKVAIANVPPCPDRSAALRKIREARMDLNSAISHKGRY